jgi:hypothetical protein
MSPIVPNGKATIPQTMQPPLESQDVSRYQATHAPVFIPVRRRGWAYLWPFAAVVAWVVMGAVWPIVPPWLRAVCIASTPIVALAALWQALGRGRL